MDELDCWRVCESLSVREAALLFSGVDPAGENGAYCEDWRPHERPHGYEAAKSGITDALKRGAIKGEFVPQYDTDINGNLCGEIPGTVDLNVSRVEVDSLREWLSRRGVRTGFFFPATNDAPDYLDPNNPRYAPKLAAAVRAWQAVTDTGNKTPKQALAKWLREHAAEFGMTDDEGKPNETGIEEAAKMANWQPGGGAPKTPGE